ncbi:hypothetical protein M9H77_07122 [Catharanthus roseus]|uniref:Uncharacterized protein n=1 Tax=Catharanthus roseus TaxID=4058 RepID=A0ACC0BUA2_CATRO|nr:hypothetical protein M9H77_07122 [Catharanthus roseus]
MGKNGTSWFSKTFFPSFFSSSPNPIPPTATPTLDCSSSDNLHETRLSRLSLILPPISATTIAAASLSSTTALPVTRHTRRGRRQHNETFCKGVVSRSPVNTPVGLGLLLSWREKMARPSHSQNCMSYCISRRDSGSIHDLTSFGGIDKGHVYGVRSVYNRYHRTLGGSSLSLVLLVSSAAMHEAFIERERGLWGYMQQAHDKFADFMTLFASHCGVQLDSVPTLFPLFLSPDDDATS